MYLLRVYILERLHLYLLQRMTKFETFEMASSQSNLIIFLRPLTLVQFGDNDFSLRYTKPRTAVSSLNGIESKCNSSAGEGGLHALAGY